MGPLPPPCVLYAPVETIVKACLGKKWLSLLFLHLIVQFSLFLNLEYWQHFTVGWTQHHCYWNYSLHPNSNHYVFCSTGLADILFSALFNSLSHNLPSPSQGHNTLFPGYQWDISAPLPPHGLCRQYLNCIHISSGAQGWRYIDDILFRGTISHIH